MSRSAFLVGLLFFLPACELGKPPLRVAEMCLVDRQEQLLFIDEMRQIAREEKMDFVDGSEDTKRGLDTIGYSDRGRTNDSPTIHIAVQRSDGVGVTAGNMGLSPHQIALGFSEGRNRPEAIQFADRVIKRLERRWRVNVLPAGSGVMPNSGCK